MAASEKLSFNLIVTARRRRLASTRTAFTMHLRQIWSFSPSPLERSRSRELNNKGNVHDLNREDFILKIESLNLFCLETQWTCAPKKGCESLFMIQLGTTSISQSMIA
jgi:hypothetical protein